MIIALVGIWLSWTTKYVKKIAANGWLYVHLQRHPELLNTGRSQNTTPSGQPEIAHDDENATEDTGLLRRDSNVSKTKEAKAFADVLIENRGIRDLFWHCFSKDVKESNNTIALLSFTAFVAILAASIIVGAYFLVRIIPDSPVRLSSEKCGLWLFDGEKRSEQATRARMLDLEKEERAAQFAEDCYGRSGFFASRCKILHQPTLPVEVTYTNECPFANEMCRLNRSVSFSTPKIDAKALGINSRLTPRFWRNTTCTPLSMDYPYIQNKTTNGVTTYTYHYGSKQVNGETLDYTYSTVGNPWDRLAPVYDLFAYSSNSDDSDHPVWTPHVNLTRAPYSTVTIIFISSLRILYEDDSSDPIFPADEKFYLPGDPEAPPWHRNSDPRARPLACINTIEVCTPDGASCWNVNEPTNNKSISDTSPEYIMLYSALYKTDIYYSFAKRQGRSLLAQKKVSQYFSSSLGDDPWVDEVESWVRTALARTSINTWSVASGEDSVHAGKGGFIELTKHSGNLCGMYKFHPRNYQSLRFVPLMLLVGSLPLMWLCSLNGKNIMEKSSPWLVSVDGWLLGHTKQLFGEHEGYLSKSLRKLLDPKRHAQTAGESSASIGPSSQNAAASSGEARVRPRRDSSDPQSSSAAADASDAIRSQDTATIREPSEDSQDTGATRMVYEPIVFYLLTYTICFVVTRVLIAMTLLAGTCSGFAWTKLIAMAAYFR